LKLPNKAYKTWAMMNFSKEKIFDLDACVKVADVLVKHGLPLQIHRVFYS